MSFPSTRRRIKRHIFLGQHEKPANTLLSNVFFLPPSVNVATPYTVGLHIQLTAMGKLLIQHTQHTHIQR